MTRCSLIPTQQFSPLPNGSASSRRVFKMPPRSKLSKTSSAFHLLILGGKWLYLCSPSGTECTVLFRRAVWKRRRASDQINVKTIRSRQKQFVSLAAERRQMKGDLCRAVKANCRREGRIFTFNGSTIKRWNRSLASKIALMATRTFKSVHFWRDWDRWWHGSGTVW